MSLVNHKRVMLGLRGGGEKQEELKKKKKEKKKSKYFLGLSQPRASYEENRRSRRGRRLT